MAGLFDNARPLDMYRSLLAPGRPSRLYTIESPYTLSRPGPAWQHAGILPGKWRDIVTERDPIYGAPQATERQTAWGIPGMAREMAGSLLNVLEAPRTGVMPTSEDILNVTPMTSAPGLLAKIPAGAMASGMARRAAAPDDPLIVQHNIHPNALERADRLGGIPMPSMAVAKADSPLTGFGEITLIGSPDMAKPSARNPVWSADAYTTRMPHIEIQPDKVAEKIIDKDYGENLGKLKSHYYGLGGADVARDLAKGHHNSNITIVAKFLNDKGLMPDPDDFQDMQQFSRAIRVIRDRFTPKNIDEFNTWSANEVRRIKDAGGAFNERIFRGFTYLGNRRYAPATLETIVREMRGKGAGGEGLHNTFGSLRAKLRPKFKSLAELKRKRGQVTSYGKAKTSFDEADQLLANYRGAVDDAATAVNPDVSMRTVDELVKDILLKRGEDEYSKPYMPAITKQIRDMADELREVFRDMPTEYFEIKPQRGVPLSEFRGAIVPKETSASTLKILKDAGITKIYKYADEAERQALFKKFPEVMFANPGAAAIPGLLSTQQPAPPPSMIMDNRQRVPRGLLDNAA